MENMNKSNAPYGVNGKALPNDGVTVEAGQAGNNVHHLPDPLAIYEGDTFNDAEIIGTLTPEAKGLLQKPFTFMLGEVHRDDKRRNTPDGKWNVQTELLHGWIKGDGKTRGLSVHPEEKKKDGTAIVFGEGVGGARTGSAITTLSAATLDFDSGVALTDVVDAVEAMGHFAIIHTSFNCGVTEMALKHDDVVRKLGLSDTPNIEQVHQYLQEHSKDHFEPEFIAACQIKDAKRHNKDGLQIVLTTPPLDKFRVIFPFAEPVVLADLAPTLDKAKAIWEDAITGLAVNHIGCTFDATSADANRAFYLPRHPNDGEYYTAVMLGAPLQFEDIQKHSKAKYLKDRKAADDPFGAGVDDAGEIEQFVTPSGASLNQWHREYKERFNIADVVETYAADKTRTAGGEKYGTVHIECPFENEHSTQGGTAAMAWNPDTTNHGYWQVTCQHDACKGRHKLHFLQEMLAQDWFDEDVLTDEGFNLPSNDDDDSPITTKTADEVADDINGFDEDTAEAEVTVYLSKLMESNADATTINKAVSQIASGPVQLGKRDLNKIVGRLRANARKSNQAAYKTPVINMWDFADMVSYGVEALSDKSDPTHPLVYQYEGDIALFKNGKRDLPKEPTFRAILNAESKWTHASTVGEDIVFRGVSVPQDVAYQLFHDPAKIYPELKEVKQTPFFAADGRLVLDEGYDAATSTYLDLGDLDVPRVSAVPTDEEVFDAKCLLIEEVLSDFPFDGVKDREERMERGIDNVGDPLPSLAHAVAMILERAARDLIGGVTPCYTITKPQPGTGGGRLIEVTSLITTGEEVSAQNMPTTDEEFVKVMSAIVNDGAAYCFFDNMNTATDSGVFASALTAPRLKARLLGTSNMVDAVVRHTWAAVANNFKGTPEIIRRLVGIELDAKMTDPTKRIFWHDDLKGWVRRNRGELVWAVLTLIQNWVAKGMKSWEGKPKASFEEWTRVMGGILRDADIRGFLENEDAFSSYAAVGGGGDDGEQLLVEHLARECANGTALRPGGVAKISNKPELAVMSVMDELNHASDGKPLVLPGWGYNSEDEGYLHARKIKQNFRDLARKTYKVVLDAGDVEVTFDEHPDPKSAKSYYWVMRVEAV